MMKNYCLLAAGLLVCNVGTCDVGGLTENSTTQPYVAKNAAAQSKGVLALSERVDEFSGSVSLVLPIGLPIKGLEGLSLQFRSPSGPREPGFTDWVGLCPRGAMYLTQNWFLGWAPSLNEIQTQDAFLPSGARFNMVDTDGTTQQFFGVSGVWSGDVYKATFVSKGQWRLKTEEPKKLNGILGKLTSAILTSPDGVVYEYGGAFDSTQCPYGSYVFTWNDLKKVTFPDGGFVTYSVEVLNDPNGRRDVFMGRNITGTASTGDVFKISKQANKPDVSVSFNNTPWVTVSSAQFDTPWGYKSTLIDKMTGPTGEVTKFSHSFVGNQWTTAPLNMVHESLVSRVDLPTGGWIEYSYKNTLPFSYATKGFYNIDGGRVKRWNTMYILAEVTQRRTSQGLITDYSYNRALGSDDTRPGIYLPRYGGLDIVTISDNAGKSEELGFFGLGFLLPTGKDLESCDYSNDSTYSYCGYLLNQDVWRLTGGDVNPVDNILDKGQAGNSACNLAANANDPYCGHPTGAWRVGLPSYRKLASEKVDYSWGSQVLRGVVRHELVPGRVPVVDYRVRQPLLSSVVNTRDGAKYTTTFTDFDQYGNAKTVTEIGPSGEKRTLARTFFVDDGKNIVRQLKNEITTLVSP